MHGHLKVDEYITFTFPLDKINEAFHVMHEGKRFPFPFPLKLLPNNKLCS